MHEQYNRLHNAYFWSCVHIPSWHNVLVLDIFILLLMSPDKVKKREIEMKHQAYETVTLPSPSRSATQVYTEPCPAYEVVVHTHH